MIIVEPTFNPTVPLTHSRIGMDNIARAGTVTASGAESGFPAAAAKTPLTYEYWRADALPAWWKIDAGSAVEVNYVGIAAHTIGTESTQVAVQYSTDDSTWVTIDSSGSVDNGPMMFLFAPVTARYWRIYLTGTGAPSIGVVYMGKTLDMERPCFGGISPINLSRRTIIRPNKSENGLWLGRSIKRQGSEMSVAYKNLSYSWYLANFDPFVRQAVSYPFFFAWRPEGYPESVGYVWTPSDISPQTQGTRDLVTVSMNLEGLSID